MQSYFQEINATEVMVLLSRLFIYGTDSTTILYRSQLYPKRFINTCCFYRRNIVLSCLTTKPSDDLLKIVGEFGKYQKIRLCMICLVSLLCAFHAQNMVFDGARPAQYCNIPPVNLSGDIWKNVTQNDFDLYRKTLDVVSEVPQRQYNRWNRDSIVLKS